MEFNEGGNVRREVPVHGENVALKEVDGEECDSERGVKVDVVGRRLNVDVADPQIAVTDQIFLFFGILAHQRGIERIAHSQPGILRRDPQNHALFRRKVASHIKRQRRRQRTEK